MPFARIALHDPNCHVYICGVMGMEDGVDEAFRHVCRQHGMDWDALRPPLRAQDRYHVET